MLQLIASFQYPYIWLLLWKSHRLFLMSCTEAPRTQSSGLLWYNLYQETHSAIGKHCRYMFKGCEANNAAAATSRRNLKTIESNGLLIKGQEQLELQTTEANRINRFIRAHTELSF